MFDELVVSTKEKKKTNRAALAISTTFQILVIGAAILYPLLVTDVLPAKAMLSTLLVAPPPPAPAPPPPPTEVVHVKPQVHLIQAGKLVAPRAIPKEVKIIKEEPEPDISGIGVAGGVPGGMPGGQAGGVIGGILGGMPSAAPPPPKASGSRSCDPMRAVAWARSSWHATLSSTARSHSNRSSSPTPPTR